MLRRMWGATVLMLAVVGFSGFAQGAPTVGQHYSWKISFRGELLGDKEAPVGSGASITGEWRETVVAVRTDGYDVRYELADVRMIGSYKRGVDAKALSEAQERLEKPFWVSCGYNGSMRSIHFLKGVSVSDRNLLQTIATETQLVRAENRDSEWTSTERDGGGRYLARYQREDGGRVRKEKLKYLDETSANQPTQPLSLTIEESDVVFKLDAEQGIESLDGVQRVRMKIPGMESNALVARIEIHLSGMHRSVERASAGKLGIPANADDLPITTHESDAGLAQVDMDRQLLLGQSNEQIISDSIRGDEIAQRRLAAMFRRRPASIAAGVEQLRGDGKGMQIVAGAMAQAGTGECVRALSKVAHDQHRLIATRIYALMSIEGIRKPTAETMRSVLNLMDDEDEHIRQAARLSSGALANSGRKYHAKVSDEVEAELVARLHRSTTVAEKKGYIDALGNSAGPGTLAALGPMLKDERVEIRNAAVDGMRLIAGDATDRLLASVAKEDESARVRGTALFAISFRAPLKKTLWDAVDHAARSDSAESVRNRAISMLRNDATRRPESENTLHWIAEHDPVEALRHVARNSLTEIRANPSSR